MKRIGLYLRISEADDGEESSTARQEADGRAYVASRDGWQVERVYRDVDLSGWNGVHRPDFEEMLDDLDCGRIDGVCGWKLDRFARNRRDFTRLIEIVEKRKAILAAVRDPVDTSSEVGWVMVDLLAAFARMESANISARVRRANEESAREGKPNVGGQRGYGYSQDWEIVPAERNVIVEAAKRVLEDGEHLYEIAADFNHRSIKTATGKQWRPHSLGRTLRSPYLAGKRVHRGEVVADGTWKPILDDDTHERLAAVLDDPTRRKGGGGQPKYLLSSLLRCGLCGAPMASRPRRDKTRRYVCHNDPGTPGCGKVGILAEPAEDEVRDRFFHRLDSPGLLDAMQGRRDDLDRQAVVTQLRGDEAALEELSRDFYVDRIIGRGEFLAARKALEDRIAETRRQLGRTAGPLAGLTSGAEAVREAWDTHDDVEWRRNLLGLLVDRIEIRASTGPKLDLARIRVIWKA